MYSVVLAAVLASGPPAPAFGGHNRHQQDNYGYSSGCIGQSCSGCFGCSGCQGCGGCRGGFLGLGITDFFRNAFSFGGCNGCSGCCGGCQGCFGGCQGCFGGCQGCFGGMSASYVVGGMPMPMDTTSMPLGMTPVPMTGDYSGAPGMTMPMWTNPPLLNPNLPGSMPQQQIPIGPPPQSQDASTPPNQATVVVTLPADARLYVEGQQLTLTGAIRVFRTPELKPNQKHSYTIKMEVERNGKLQDETKKVELQPGKTTQVLFADPAVSSGTARIDVAIPEGSILTVEGQTIPSGQRSIQTPALENGKDYVYTLKLERDRQGKKETLTREVSFRAGEVVTVSFDKSTNLAKLGR